MKKTLFLLLFFKLSFSYGQEGHLSLRHFQVPLPKQDHVFYDMTTDAQGRLLLAHRRGLLQFDGRSWEKIALSSSPLKFLSIDNEDFLLTKEDISLIYQDSYYQNKIKPLFKNPPLVMGQDLVKFKNKFYYLAGDEISVLHSENFELDTVLQSHLGYNDIFAFQDRLFAFEGNFLVEYFETAWVDLNLQVTEETDFIFSCQTDSLVFFAYDNGDFFAFDGNNLSVFSPELNEYLQDNYPVSGKIFDNKIIIATLNGGAVVVDIESRKILSTIQYFNGLPSDEVKAITADEQNGLWLAHGAGISRASFNLPITEFQHYPGLRGIPETLLMQNDTLFVGTSTGLFYLAQVKNYEVLQKVMKEKVPLQTKFEEEEQQDEPSFIEKIFTTEDAADKEEVYIKEQLKKYKKIYRGSGYHFRKLRDKLAEKEVFLRDSLAELKENEQTPQAQKNYVAKQQDRYKVVTKTVNISKLKSIKYQYLAVEGLNGKISELISTPKGILAIGTKGVFLINKGKATQLTDLRFLQKAFYERESNVLWLAGGLGFYSIDLGDDNKQAVRHFSAPVHDVLLHKNELALAGENQVFIFKHEGEELSGLKTYTVANEFLDKMMLLYEGDSLKILKLDGLYHLNKSLDSAVLERDFTEGLKYFVKDNRQAVWLNQQNDEWKILNKDGAYPELQWMKIMPYVKYIHHLSKSDIMFIADDRILLLEKGNSNFDKTPRSFINAVYKEDQKLSVREDLELEHNNNSIRINLSTIDYLFPEGVRYQYYLKGLMDDWSAWFKGGEINFPYLPSGDYTLEIRAKSGLSGKVTDYELPFKVLPPYWRTWWFYSIEIVFFSLLIFISIKMNRSSKNSYLTSAITFLTLILLLEFMATIVENNLEGYIDESPVYGFVINVILALSITPIEKGVNRLLLIVNTRKVKKIAGKMRSKQLENREKVNE